MLIFLIVVPNHCWFQGHQYECGLSLSCVFSGSKPLDLCNGGMVWSCCVPRGRDGGGGSPLDDLSDDYDTYGVVNDPRKTTQYSCKLFKTFQQVIFLKMMTLVWDSPMMMTIMLMMIIFSMILLPLILILQHVLRGLNVLIGMNFHDHLIQPQQPSSVITIITNQNLLSPVMGIQILFKIRVRKKIILFRNQDSMIDF